MEGGEGHVNGVDGGEVGELLEGDGLGNGIGGTELAAYIVEGFRNDEGRGGGKERRSEGFYQIVQGPLEEVLHDRR